MGRWGVYFGAIVALGLLSRLRRTGFVILDEYLGDALYAAMIYAALRWALGARWTRRRVALVASMVMLGIECFQLTGFAESILRNGQFGERILARLLGTTFQIADLLAYAVGIALLYTLDEGKQL